MQYTVFAACSLNCCTRCQSRPFAVLVHRADTAISSTNDASGNTAANTHYTQSEAKYSTVVVSSNFSVSRKAHATKYLERDLGATRHDNASFPSYHARHELQLLLLSTVQCTAAALRQGKHRFHLANNNEQTTRRCKYLHPLTPVEQALVIHVGARDTDCHHTVEQLPPANASGGHR